MIVKTSSKGQCYDLRNCASYLQNCINKWIVVVNIDNNLSLGSILWFSPTFVFPCITLKDIKFLASSTLLLIPYVISFAGTGHYTRLQLVYEEGR